MLDLTKFIVCIADLSMVTFSGTAHIQMISFLPGTGKHFTGKPLCSSDDSVMQLKDLEPVHDEQYLTLTCIKKSIGDKFGKWIARKWVPSTYRIIRKFPVQKGRNTTGESETVHRVNGKLFPQEHNEKQCSPP